MKLLQGRVVNFGSYKELDFDFSHLGLTLVYGATGSGKSTLCDIAAWILYGVTAKDGNADEVRSWHSPNEKTEGHLNVTVRGTTIAVYRCRGKSTENDLFWIEADQMYRGKDITDTQKMLEKRLGVSTSLYLLSAYFHEFSESGKFFTAKAKDRREVFEKVTSLDLPVKISEKTSEHRKVAKKELADVSTKVSKLEGKMEQLGRSTDDAIRSEVQWETKQADRIEHLMTQHEKFEENKQSNLSYIKKSFAAFEKERAEIIDDLIHRVAVRETEVLALEDRLLYIKESQTICPTCGGADAKAVKSISEATSDLSEARHEHKALLVQIQALQSAKNPHVAKIADEEARENNFDLVLQETREEKNPFKAQVERFREEERSTYKQLVSERGIFISLDRKVGALTALYDLSFDLRGALLAKTVKEIEARTNSYLERYFDAEIRVDFTLDSDDLEVAIQKNGYECVYRQLSKGQRQLLKLCFSIAVMQVSANSAGVHFDNLFMDEALDGLDSSLKVKAFGLFQELEKEHESILLIEHSTEFQTLFNKRYRVSLNGDCSTLEEDNE